MTPAQLELLRAIIDPYVLKQLRHPDYDHTVEKKAHYRAMLSGIGLNDLVPRVTRRETEEEYTNRMELTTEIVTPAVNQVVTKFRYTSRLEGINRNLYYTPESERSKTQLLERIKKFWAGQDVDYYVRQELDTKMLGDPNAFLIVDFLPFTTGRPVCYPVIVGCENVAAYSYNEPGELSWLLITKTETVTDKDGVKKDLTDYIAYLGDIILVYHQEHEARDHTGLKIIGTLHTEEEDRSYQIEQLEPNAGRVQAERLGYLMDEATEHRTCISPLDYALPFVIDLMKDKSGYDWAKADHVFPQKLQFTEPCPGESNSIGCNNGTRTPGGGKCKKCEGHGYITHRGPQDTLTFPLPTSGSKEDMPLKLAEIIHYVKPELESVKHLREDIEAGVQKIPWAVFCSQHLKQVQNPTTSSGPSIHKTATEYAIEADSENNTLQPFAEHKSRLYKFIVGMIAKFNDLADNLTILYEFPHNLRMITLEELEADYQNAVTAGAPAFMLDRKADEVAVKKFSDDPEALQKYKVRSILQPFRHRPSADVQFAIGAGLVTKADEVLWANFEDIMNQVEVENSNFYRLAPKEQRRIVKEAAKEYANELTPVIVAPFQRGAGPQRPEEEEQAA